MPIDGIPHIKGPIMELRKVERHYASGKEVVRAIDGINLTVHSGEFTTITGASGSGKSTLLNKILGQKIAIISNKPQTTRRSILGIKTTPKGQIIFVDNPGIHKPLHKLNKRMMSFVFSFTSSRISSRSNEKALPSLSGMATGLAPTKFMTDSYMGNPGFG